MKKLFFTIAALAITGMVCAQQPQYPKTIEGQSRAAVKQAKNGDVVGAYNTAKRTLMNDDMSKSATHGLPEAVQKKADKSREQHNNDKDKNTSGNTTGSSGSQTDKTGTTTNGKK